MTFRAFQYISCSINFIDFFFLFSRKEWRIGHIKADAQNVARRLMDMPSNKMTPIIFANVSNSRKKVWRNFNKELLFT